MNNQSKSSKEVVYELNGRPSLAVAIPFGLQHVLAMFVGNLAPILVLAGIIDLSSEYKVLMVQSAMIVSGLTTMVQLYPIKIGSFQIGSGLPIVMGTSFAFVPTMTTVAQAGLKKGLAPELIVGTILGGTLLGGITEIIMGILIKPLKRFFPPLVVGSVLMVIGINLLSVGATYFGGGAYVLQNFPEKFASPKSLALGFITFFVIIGVQKFCKGTVKAAAILIGIVVGYIVALAFGVVNVDSIVNAKIIDIPLPFGIKPTFDLTIAASFAAIYLISGLETIGNTGGITIAAFDREATDQETSGAILADAVGSMVAATWNTLPNTAFGQNAGIIALTKVINKFCIFTGAVILVVAGFFPKVGAIFSAIPDPVLGGAVITVFAIILINGIKLISLAGFSENNILALGVTFGLGYGIFASPAILEGLPSFLSTLLHDKVVAVTLTGIIANILFNFKDIMSGKNASSEMMKKIAEDI